MKCLLFLLALLLSLTGFTQKTINDPNAELRSVGAFTGIAVSDGIDLYLSQGENAVAVSASKEGQNHRIMTEVKNGVLHIHHQSSGVTVNWGNNRLRAYVSASQLKSIEAGGGSDVVMEGMVKATDFVLVVSGGSDFKGAVEATTLTVKQSGGSDVTISGKTTALVVSASGGSDFNGYELSADICVVEVHGGSDASVSVSKELTAKASGASDVSYRGAPSVKTVETSGASSVKGKSPTP